MSMERLLREALATPSDAAYEALCTLLLRKGYGHSGLRIRSEFCWRDAVGDLVIVPFYPLEGGFVQRSVENILGIYDTHCVNVVVPASEERSINKLSRWLSYDIAEAVYERSLLNEVVYPNSWRRFFEVYGSRILWDLLRARFSTKKEGTLRYRHFSPVLELHMPEAIVSMELDSPRIATVEAAYERASTTLSVWEDAVRKCLMHFEVSP